MNANLYGVPVESSQVMLVLASIRALFTELLYQTTL